MTHSSTFAGYTDADGHSWPKLSADGEYEPGVQDFCSRCGLNGNQAMGRKCADTIAPAALVQTEFEYQWLRFEEFARGTFEADLKRARAKAMEYGSHDLEIMAVSMEALLPAGELDPQSRHATAIEMSIAFYLMGKVARMFGAFKKGTTPGDDSWRDGLIYSLMGRYVRQNGRWIG